MQPEGVDEDHRPAHLGAELDRIIDGGLIVPVYQPIVELASEQVVAYEALARGPEGSHLQRPDQLFRAAEATGRLDALDWACRTAAVQGALDARLRPPFSLFLNAEPHVLDSRMPAAFAGSWVTARMVYLRLMFEITERALTDRPAELISNVRRLRSWGWGVALDDVGADPRSLAMLPFLRPDVIKLDMRVTQDPDDIEVAEAVVAVNAEAERSGATIVAEGIETEAHLQTARAFGAHLAQGWYFGRPEPIPEPLPVAGPQIVISGVSEAEEIEGSPFEYLRKHLQPRVATVPRLLSLTRLLERRAASLPQPPVIVSAFQTAQRFVPAASLYAELAERLPLVVALGLHMQSEPAAGVRGVSLEEGDPLTDEWVISTISPYSAAMLAARELPADPRGSKQRIFESILTLNRDLVVAATKLVVARLVGEVDQQEVQRDDEVSFATAVAEAVAEAKQTEDLARPLLRLMSEMTGLESTFLSKVTEERDYDILVSENNGSLHVPEGTHLAWSQAVCKQALDVGRQSFDDLPQELPEDQSGRALGFRTFVTCPVVIEDGKVVGTLCGASSKPGGLSKAHVDMVRSFAALIASHVAQSASGSLADAGVARIDDTYTMP